MNHDARCMTESEYARPMDRRHGFHNIDLDRSNIKTLPSPRRNYDGRPHTDSIEYIAIVIDRDMASR